MVGFQSESPFPWVNLPRSLRQLLVDPVFTLDDIFPIEAPYGAQMDWFRDKPGWTTWT